MEKCSQKRPRCRWLAWCSGPPAPRVTALACTTCSSFPIRQTYTCGNGSLQKNIYMKKIFGNRMMRPTRTWCNSEQIRHNIVLTWTQPRIEPRKEQPPGEERGRGNTHRDAVSFLLWHHLHFYVFNFVLLFVDVQFPKTQSWNEKLSTSTDQVIR